MVDCGTSVLHHDGVRLRHAAHVVERVASKVWRYGCMTCGVAETPPVTERRLSNRNDRRAHSRSGRRSTDPRMNWRRIAWLFAAYAAYLSVRSLSATVRDAVPAKLKKLFKREETAA